MSASHSTMSASCTIEKVRVEGIWVGVIEVELVKWTANMLRAEVARQLDCSAQSICLISSDAYLFDSALTLSQFGIKNNARILSNRSGFGQNGEQHVFFPKMWCKFAKISEVLERKNDCNNEQEDHQTEKKFHLGSRNDQKATLLGLTIHSEAKVLIKRGKYNGALELLDLAERTFSLCNQENLEMIDNMVLLNIETVWCHYMLQDISAITTEGGRLTNAREGLEVALERDFSRIRRFLPGVPLLETALSMRLELLEGIFYYHTDRLEDAQKALELAEEKHLQLKVPEEFSLFVQGWNFKDERKFKEEDVNMALRINKNEVFKSIRFLQAKQPLDCSPSVVKKMKAVSIEKLKDLVSIGFDMFLVVEALKKNKHNEVKAFVDLCNPHTNSLSEEQLRGSKRRRTLSNAPMSQPGETSYVVELRPFEASESSSESESIDDDNTYDSGGDDDDDSDFDSDDDSDDYTDYDSDNGYIDGEKKPVNLVQDLANSTAPANYDIEYHHVDVGIKEYLTLIKLLNRIRA